LLLFFVVNSKNYLETSGEHASALGRAVDSVSQEPRIANSVKLVVAVPAFSLAKLASEFEMVDFYAQHLDDQEVGSTTGYLVPEVAKSYGAKGSLINHSEHRLPVETIDKLVNRLKGLSMCSVVCAVDEAEVSRFAEFEPDYIAVEPPELIGSGKAVSKTRPEVITNSKKELSKVVSRLGSKTRLLCGAGIVDPIDATLAVRLGAEGILVASGVTKAKDWVAAVRGLALGLTAEEGKQ
jgi:triosephosphate isomerase (TIM)